MRTAHLLAVASISLAGISLAGIPLIAQQAGAAFQQNSTVGTSVHQSSQAGVTAQAKPANASLSSAAAGTTNSSATAKTEQMTSVSGELQGKLDTKTAKVGDQVVLKTTAKVRTADGTVIPKGTRLIGHVTAAQAHDSAHAESQLGIAFDRAELKSGQSMAIHSSIQSIEPRPNIAAQSSMADDDMFADPAGSGMAGGRAVAGGRIGGGGVMGGAVERTSAITSTEGERVGSSTASAAHATDAAARGTEHVAGSAAAGSRASVHGVANASGRVAGQASERATMRTTGIPGVMLRNSASGSASGTLSESNKNVHLDSGTQMDLNFAASGK